MNFQITNAAALRVSELIKKSTKIMSALRVSVDGGGCSGFMYQYQLTDKINDDDHIITSNGIKVVIDPTSQDFLNDSTIEFIQELGGSYFRITNPNASAKCGCGNSFAL